MTEAEWLAADDYWPLHEYLWHNAKGRPRKYRLASCGMYRLTCQLFSERLESDFIELGESFADDPGLSPRIKDFKHDSIPRTFPFDVCYPPEYASYDSNNVSRVVSFIQDRLGDSWWERHPTHLGGDEDEARSDVRSQFIRQADVVGATVLRDIFGNPFRPAAFDHSWLTTTVLALAEGIYQQRAFDRMPILADALQDAGCEHPDILTHCRSDGPHVRGCWVVDLLTGRK